MPSDAPEHQETCIDPRGAAYDTDEHGEEDTSEVSAGFSAGFADSSGGDRSSGFADFAQAKADLDEQEADLKRKIVVVEDPALDKDAFISRVQEVGQEEGIHFLEDGHFWVEIPGLNEYEEELDEDYDEEFGDYYYDIATAVPKEKDNDSKGVASSGRHDNSTANDVSTNDEDASQASNDNSEERSMLEDDRSRRSYEFAVGGGGSGPQTATGAPLTGIPFHKPSKIHFSCNPIQVSNVVC